MYRLKRIEAKRGNEKVSGILWIPLWTEVVFSNGDNDRGHLYWGNKQQKKALGTGTKPLVNESSLDSHEADVAFPISATRKLVPYKAGLSAQFPQWGARLSLHLVSLAQSLSRAPIICLPLRGSGAQPAEAAALCVSRYSTGFFLYYIF